MLQWSFRFSESAESQWISAPFGKNSTVQLISVHFNFLNAEFIAPVVWMTPRTDWCKDGSLWLWSSSFASILVSSIAVDIEWTLKIVEDGPACFHTPAPCPLWWWTGLRGHSFLWFLVGNHIDFRTIILILGRVFKSGGVWMKWMWYLW